MANLRFEDDLHSRRVLRWLVFTCGPLLAGGLALASMQSSEPAFDRNALNLLKDATIVEIRDSEGRGVLTGEFRSQKGALGNTEFDAALKDQSGQTVVGEVELDIPSPSRAGRRPELEVDIISLAPQHRYTVAIDDRVVASFTTDDRGSIDRELQEGEGSPLLQP